MANTSLNAVARARRGDRNRKESVDSVAKRKNLCEIGEVGGEWKVN